MSAFAPPTYKAPAFAGVRARPGQKFAVEWAKRRLREIYREARAAGRDSPLTEAAAHLFLLIATYVLDGRFISEWIPLQDFGAIMHCVGKTVRRARKLLTAEGLVELVEGGQGNALVRFKLPFDGPLYAEKGGAAAAAGASTSTPRVRSSGHQLLPSESEVAATTSTPRVRSSPQLLPPESEVATAHPFMYLEEEGTSSSTESAEENAEAIFHDSMTVDEQRAALDASVAQRNSNLVRPFVAWWIENFPLHNDGWRCTVRDCDHDAAFDLFSDYTMDQLQALSPVYWAVQAVRGHQRDCRCNPCYIAGSDKSIRVLQQTIRFVVQELRRRGATARDVPEDLYARADAEQLAKELRRIHHRLQDLLRSPAPGTPPSLSTAVARIAQEVSTFDSEGLLDDDRRRTIRRRLAQLEAELMHEARVDADLVRVVRADADQQLAGFHHPATTEVYQRVHLRAVDQLLRERYKLPKLSDRVAASDESQPEQRTGTEGQ